MMKSLEVQIAEHPFLKGMSPVHLKTLADLAMHSRFEAGESIFREGDPANRFYLLQQGKVALESSVGDRGTILIQTIGAGDVLGWSWLFPPYYWHFDARAVTPVQAIFFYGTRVRKLCDENHDLGYALMRRVSEIVIKRLQATRKELVEHNKNMLLPV